MKFMTFGWTAFLCLAATSLTASAHADQKSCESMAASKVYREFREDFYLEDGTRQRQIDNVSCERKQTIYKKRGYVYCEVSASTGDGAGDVTYGVLLTSNCEKAFRAYEVGRE